MPTDADDTRDAAPAAAAAAAAASQGLPSPSFLPSFLQVAAGLLRGFLSTDFVSSRIGR